MIIKLNNAAEQFLGHKLLINTDHIVSVFETTADDGSTKTFLYTSTNLTYEVGDSLDKIFEMVKND